MNRAFNALLGRTPRRSPGGAAGTLGGGLEPDARIELLISDAGLPAGFDGRQLADAARIPPIKSPSAGSHGREPTTAEPVGLAKCEVGGCLPRILVGV